MRALNFKVFVTPNDFTNSIVLYNESSNTMDGLQLSIVFNIQRHFKIYNLKYSMIIAVFDNAQCVAQNA